MNTEIKAPLFPESIQNGVIAKWHKQEGDSVQRDELLVEIETDKIVLEVCAPSSGILRTLLKSEDALVDSQEVIGFIDTGGAETSTSIDTCVHTKGDHVNDIEDAPSESIDQGDVVAVTDSDDVEVKVNPAAHHLILEHGLKVDQLVGTGKGARITKEDVLNYLAKPVDMESGEKSVPMDASVADSQGDVQPAPVSCSTATNLVVNEDNVDNSVVKRDVKYVPMSRLRQRVAERLLTSKQQTAMLTTFNEVDMHSLMDLRRQYRDEFEQKHGVGIGYMSFFVKASVIALQKFPTINAYIEGSDIAYHNYQDIGVAIASERGLVVPILRNVQDMNLAGIERKIADYVVEAQAGRLNLDDLVGGTFTLSNGGVFGSLLSTPIINPPQTAILGMHSIQKRPVVIADEIVIRPMMYLALSYDHRLIDGKEAVQFLLTIKQLIEDPSRILLEL